MPQFVYIIGDRIRVDRSVLEEHGEAVRGFTEKFKDLDDVRGTVKYVRRPYVWRGEERREPTVVVSLDEIAGYTSTFTYYPEEIDLIERGVNSEAVTKLSQELDALVVKLRDLTQR
jgi:hypothetical protein